MRPAAFLPRHAFVDTSAHYALIDPSDTARPHAHFQDPATLPELGRQQPDYAGHRPGRNCPRSIVVVRRPIERNRRPEAVGLRHYAVRAWQNSPNASM